MKQLFISHAEKDSTIVKAFVDLLFQIGLTERDMFCSSISELGVPIKEDIYSYLRNILDSEDVIPVFMLSENYYSSAACLNEMGAVWLKQKDYYTFLLPGFSFKEIRGAINPNIRAIKLDKDLQELRKDLTGFKDSLRKNFALPEISNQRWETWLDAFIQKRDNFIKQSEITFDIFQTQAFCIGDTNRGACEINADKATRILTFQYNFRKTKAKLCSMVLFIGGIDLQREFRAGKKLSFWIRAWNYPKEVTVEMHLSSMNPAKRIRISNEWRQHSIELSEFTNLKNLWKCCNEICFVVDRGFIKRGKVEVKEIKIT